MKILGMVLIFFVGVAIVILAAGQLGLLQWKKPDDLGVQDSKFKRPSLTPNSVSSQADLYPEHPQKEYAHIEPIRYTGDGQLAMARLADIVQHLERTVVVTREPSYLYAQCTSKFMKFTDDVEFWLDARQGVIQVRSASRLGRKDFGVNRARIETIRAQFDKN